MDTEVGSEMDSEMATPMMPLGRVQMCQVQDIAPREPECLRIAQIAWQPDPEAHPVFLCNFHGEPFLADMVAGNADPGH